MHINETELKEELKHLDETKKTIKTIIESKDISIEDYKKQKFEAKKFIYDNQHEMTDAELCESMNKEDLDVDIINKDIIKNIKLFKSLENPYFGRIDFVTDTGESIYIGLTSVEKDYDYIVYDWRAPISNLYYNFELGNAYFNAPNGVINGNIILKRQFDIEMGTLKKCYDNEVALNDKILEDVLLSSSDDKMKNIVNTIQKEQNEIIRYTGKETLVIEGIAGSGKSSVALHRIAYLLYNQRDLTSNNVLIFSPNELFSNYISNVLPDLGENNCFATTFTDFAENFIPDIKLENLSEFLEKAYSNKSNNKDGINYKLSFKYQKLIDEYILDYTKNLNFTKSLGLNKILITSEELNKELHSDKKLTFNDKIHYLTTKICESFKVEDDKNHKKMFGAVSKLLHLDTNPISEYNSFLASSIYQSKFEPKRVVDEVNYEDIFGMLYLHFELNGYPAYSHIKHIIIDEAQDYTLMQYALVKKIFASATFTILGDKNQAVNPFIKYSSLNEINSCFKNSKYIMMNKTYRSSKEIISYTNKILGIENITSIRDNIGVNVLEKNETDLKNNLINDIDYLKEKGMKRIAIITKTEKETDYIYELIKDKNIGKNNQGILKNISVLPAFMAKGLEFDAVISYNYPQDKYKDDEKYLFYVACTRAQHILIVYNK